MDGPLFDLSNFFFSCTLFIFLFMVHLLKTKILPFIMITTVIAPSFQIPANEGDPASTGIEMQARESEVTIIFFK